MQLLGRLPWWRRGQSSELARADAVCELIDAEDACSCQASDGLPDAADCSTADVESGGSGGSSSSSSASSSASLGNGDGDCCCLRDSGRDHHGRRPGDASNAACCSDAASVASSPASQGSTSSSSGGSGCALIPAGMGSSVGPEPGRHVDPLDKDVTGKLDLPKSRASLEEFASCGGLQREGLALHTSSWLAVRLVYPYMLAAFVPPLVTAIILPLVLSPQVRQSSVLGDWSIQLTVLANQLGNVTGSALLPIPRLRRPRATLLAAALAMLPFVGAFVVVLKLQAGPAVVIPISYVMYLASGYLTTTVFGIAPGGLRAADAELVQALLVLTTAASFVLGSGVAWSWLAAKPAC